MQPTSRPIGSLTALSLVAALLVSAPAASLAAEPDEGVGAGDDPAVCKQDFTVFRKVPEPCLGAIDTDRPHKTDTPHLVPAGHVQVELGVVEYEIDKVSASDPALVLFNNIYKIGLTDRVDLQLLHAPGSYSVRAKRFEPSTQMMLRSKINVVGGKGGQGDVSVSLVPAVITPLRSGTRFELGGFVFFGAELPFDLDLEVNVGAFSETDSETGKRHAAPVVTTALTRRVFGPISVFAELYHDTTTRDLRAWNATFDTGLLVLAGRDVQLDFGAYVGLYGAVPALTPFVGLSARR